MIADKNATTPEYLPARMLNEFVYCPRLFYYEWVEGVFAHNRETVEGSIRHAKLDAQEEELPTAAEATAEDQIHARSVTLSSHQHRLIAKLDVVEALGNLATPVDYKRGKPRQAIDGTLLPWDADKVQICAQALVLRDNGYACEEGIIYYVATKQRVRIPITPELVDWTLQALEKARQTADSNVIPPPLLDSPKCPRCSLVGICLPDETRVCSDLLLQQPIYHQRALFPLDLPLQATTRPTQPATDEPTEVRRLLPARDDLRPLYLNTQGLFIGKTSNVLRVKEKDKIVQDIRINEICQLNLFGNIQLSTQAIQTLCENEVPIAYFSQGGWFYGVTHGLGVRNIYLRKEQFKRADSPSFCLELSRALVAGKIRNQRVMFQRNHIEPSGVALAQMKCMMEDAEHASSLETLLGIEGNAARIYFENLSGMIKSAADDPATKDLFSAHEVKPFSFDFKCRNRRPPKDPVNALLSLAYSMLAKDLTIVCHTVGFDPFLGFYHQPRFGRAPLALDLMEPFRPLIADSAVLTAINTRMVTLADFIQAGDSVVLTASGRKAFFRAYEQRMDTLVTHPLFGYRINYRRMLEVQTRLLARLLMGEMQTYPVFTTR